MSLLRTLANWLVATALILPLGACGGENNSALGVAVIGSAGDAFATGSPLPLAAQLVRAGTDEGLVSFDEQGRVIPALADRWIVTDDGQSYIFRLRDGMWSNGDPITAKSARTALNAAFKSVKALPLGDDLSGIADVRTMAGRVIEIRLNRPMPYLLQLLAQPELGLIHDKRGSGPMTMVRRANVAELTPINPEKLGLPEIADWKARTRKINVLSMGAAGAVDSFNAGKVDLVLGGRFENFPLSKSVGILRGTIQVDPVAGLFGLQVMNDRGFLSQPDNREALAMAIDRGKLLSGFGLGGWKATSRLVGADLDGDLGTIGERWVQQSMDERRGIAAQRVRQWVASGGLTAVEPGTNRAAKVSSGAKAGLNGGKQRAVPQARGQSTSSGVPPTTFRGPSLSVWLPQGPGSDMLFANLATDFQTIGVTLTRAQDNKAADLALVDAVARYPQASWYLNRLSCTSTTGLCSKDADARLAEAAQAMAPADRSALLAEAEAELTAANVYIPFGAPIRWSLVRGSVRGFSANAWGWHPLMPLAWIPK